MKTTLIVLTLVFFQFFAYSQDLTEKHIKEIRNEYAYINSNLAKFSKKEIFVSNDEVYWRNTNYTGYLNDKNQLVFLTYKVGEEGYGTEIQYYFKNDKLFFNYVYSIDPEENETEERYYFYDSQIIKALIKERKFDNKLSLDKIANKENKEVIKNVVEFSKIQVDNANLDKKQFFDAINKE
ncbi:MAG: hypothetical protein JXR51_12610 [Bacteroidales bacterium]|nr:hypothetical protein [Bacteroidales bacterium]MBN2758011.1 hypothetical protein [Bacteroidales bacterium]